MQTYRAHRVWRLGGQRNSDLPRTRGVLTIVSPEQLATSEAFAKDAELVWQWYDWHRQHVAAAHPNRVHDVLAAWSRRFAHFSLITQNVDGLHERARANNVRRFHGSIWELRRYSRCPSSPDRWYDDTTPFPTLRPHCAHCEGLARRGVFCFGEAIDPVILDRSLAASFCDLLLAIGTSALVHPAALLLQATTARISFTAEIKLESTPGSGDVDLALRGPAEKILPDVENCPRDSRESTG